MTERDDLIYLVLERLEQIERKIDSRVTKVWLSISDVIQMTGYSRSTINKAISLGELKSVKHYRKRMFKYQWINNWIEG